MRLSFLAAVLALLAAARLPAAVPWADGETLDYLVHWGPMPVAAARFTAHAADGGWRFALDLRSRGAVEALHPVRAAAHSVTRTDPWRSVEYGEDYTVGEKAHQEITTLDYAAGTGLFRDRVKKTSKSFPLPGPAVDDIGSMLYGLRRMEWGAGTGTQTLQVCTGPRVVRAEVTAVRREAISPRGGGAPVPCRVVRVEPVYGDPKKDARGYFALLWISDDARRLPLHAEFKAGFGTFDVDWMPAAPAS